MTHETGHYMRPLTAHNHLAATAAKLAAQRADAHEAIKAERERSSWARAALSDFKTRQAAQPQKGLLARLFG
jgi:hypothetical protein